MNNPSTTRRDAAEAAYLLAFDGAEAAADAAYLLSCDAALAAAAARARATCAAAAAAYLSACDAADEATISELAREHEDARFQDDGEAAYGRED